MTTETLADLIERGSLVVNDGYRTKASELGSPGIPILRVAEIGNGTVNPVHLDHVREEYRAVIGSKVSRPGDVLLTTKGTVGRRAIISSQMPELVYSPQLCFFRVLDESIDARWLYYWLGGADFWLQASGMSTQTDMAPYLSLRDLRAVRIKLPPLEEQRQISATLWSLDEKIQSNRTAIESIDHLARLIFKEWRDQLAAAEQTTFGKFADVYGGTTPQTSVPDYWDGGLAWTTPTDVTRLAGAPYLFATTRTITQEGLASCAAVMHPTGTIFMTSRATIGAFAVNQIPAATNQGFIVVRPRREVERWFLFEEMRSRIPEFIDHANGSTFLEISRGNFKGLPLTVPSESELAQLDKSIGPLHRKAAQLVAEADRLAGLRDLLLPELLSGRVRVLEAA